MDGRDVEEVLLYSLVCQQWLSSAHHGWSERLLLSEALEILIRAHITCAVRVHYSWQNYTTHNTDHTSVMIIIEGASLSEQHTIRHAQVDI